MFQNSKTRYLHSFHQHFGRKLWSFGFEDTFHFIYKFKAPGFSDLMLYLLGSFFGFGTWEHLSRKTHFPGAHAWEIKKMLKTQCFFKQILNSRGASNLNVKKLKNRVHLKKNIVFYI